MMREEGFYDKINPIMVFGLNNKNRNINVSEAQVDEFLSRGVEDVFVKDDLRKKLLGGKVLRIKLGVDPTSPHIHIGRAIPLRKLRKLQDMGHQVVFLVGDFTALIGDASDKLSKRPMLTAEQVNLNLKTYKEQVGKILDLKKAEFHYNSKWLSKLNFKDVCELAETFTLQQMIERRNFKDRIEKGEEISLRELMYPLMQGYDSVALKADIEIGGFDQLFNLKAGRVIQRHFGQPEQNIITFKMLSGTDGRKMSSSWGNIIAINDAPNDMYGKVMSIKDELLEEYFLMTTDRTMEFIEDAKNKIGAGTNPKELKMLLARDIVTMFHGEAAGKKAEENFVSVFSNKETPKDVPKIKYADGELLSDVLVKNKTLSSKSDFARLVKEGAITNLDTNEKVPDIHFKAIEGTYKIGKHRFVKIINNK
ncbi:MAG: tyrS [Candidatus Taylorbacteria bacterium]|nr:tyrS [Candidatus Taylorbacteria bacterium]